MLRILTRLLGLLLVVLAFAALVVDGTRSVAGGGLYFTSLGRALAALAPGGPAAIDAFGARSSGFLWDPAVSALLLAPASLALGALGAAAIVLSHRDDPEAE